MLMYKRLMNYQSSSSDEEETAYAPSGGQSRPFLKAARTDGYASRERVFCKYNGLDEEIKIYRSEPQSEKTGTDRKGGVKEVPTSAFRSFLYSLFSFNTRTPEEIQKEDDTNERSNNDSGTVTQRQRRRRRATLGNGATFINRGLSRASSIFVSGTRK